MNVKFLIRQAAMTCLIAVFIAVHSMVAFAGTGKTVGNLSVVSLGTGNEKSVVRVNGETAISGRSIFSSSIIETTDYSGAVISAGKLGKIELAANSKFVVSFDNDSISGDLMAGSISVIDSTEPVSVNAGGQNIKLKTGESTAASEKNLPTSSSARTKVGGWGWLPWTLIVIGGAAATFVVVAATNKNDLQIGSSVSVVSPTR